MHLVKASNRVDDLSATYEEVSQGLTGLVKASAEGANHRSWFGQDERESHVFE